MKVEYITDPNMPDDMLEIRPTGFLKETMQKAGYRHVKTIGEGEHVLQNNLTGELEVWAANKGHASYGIIYKNTDLEFCRSLSLGEVAEMTQLKYFFVTVTTQYDGYEWTQDWLACGKSEEKVTKRLAKVNFTHFDDFEDEYPQECQEVSRVREISHDDYYFLLENKYVNEAD